MPRDGRGRGGGECRRDGQGTPGRRTPGGPWRAPTWRWCPRADCRGAAAFTQSWRRRCRPPARRPRFRRLLGGARGGGGDGSSGRSRGSRRRGRSGGGCRPGPRRGRQGRGGRAPNCGPWSNRGCADCARRRWPCRSAPRTQPRRRPCARNLCLRCCYRCRRRRRRRPLGLATPRGRSRVAAEAAHLVQLPAGPHHGAALGLLLLARGHLDVGHAAARREVDAAGMCVPRQAEGEGLLEGPLLPG